jgi:hypothetical protein
MYIYIYVYIYIYIYIHIYIYIYRNVYKYCSKKQPNTVIVNNLFNKSITIIPKTVAVGMKQILLMMQYNMYYLNILHIHTYIHVYKYIYIYVCLYIHIYKHVYIYIYICIYMCM